MRSRSPDAISVSGTRTAAAPWTTYTRRRSSSGIDASMIGFWVSAAEIATTASAAVTGRVSSRRSLPIRGSRSSSTTANDSASRTYSTAETCRTIWNAAKWGNGAGHHTDSPRKAAHSGSEVAHSAVGQRRSTTHAAPDQIRSAGYSSRPLGYIRTPTPSAR